MVFKGRWGGMGTVGEEVTMGLPWALAMRELGGNVGEVVAQWSINNQLTKKAEIWILGIKWFYIGIKGLTTLDFLFTFLSSLTKKSQKVTKNNWLDFCSMYYHEFDAHFVQNTFNAVMLWYSFSDKLKGSWKNLPPKIPNIAIIVLLFLSPSSANITSFCSNILRYVHYTLYFFVESGTNFMELCNFFRMYLIFVGEHPLVKNNLIS